MSGPSAPLVGVVVLTQGNRPDALAAALASVSDQRDVRVEVVVVGNGWSPTGLAPTVRRVHLPQNMGIPAGRNAGVDAVAGELVLFLDDDELLGQPDFLSSAVAKFAADRDLGLLQPRVEALDGVAPRRWIPRLRKGDARRSSYVFNCVEGAVVVRREVFDRVGRWPERFFYAHEGIDLAYRLWAAGSTVWYAGDLVALHPAVEPSRHPDYLHNNARNRVWVARRNLPLPLAIVYMATWTGVHLARAARHRDGAALRPWFAGWLAGWRTDPGGRHPMSWSTVWRMTRLGRPPVV